jgi:hypothetical protein
VALAAFAIIIGYGLFVEIVRPDAVISYDSGLRNRVIAEQFVDEPTKRAVLVGSSLGARLSPDITGPGPGLGPDIYNLAMLGQNSATGLDIVLHKDRMPNLVLIEMNILEHPYDPQFVEQIFEEPWRSLRRAFPLFRLENRPLDLSVVAVEKTAKFLLNKAGMHSVESVYSPQSDKSDDDQATLQSRLTNDINEVFLKNVRIALGRLGDQVDLLQSKKIRVILLRFPVDSAFDSTPKERYKRDKAYERFPREKYQWYNLQDTGDYKTLDGLHLTSFSARDLEMVIRKIADTSAGGP